MKIVFVSEEGLISHQPPVRNAVSIEKTQARNSIVRYSFQNIQYYFVQRVMAIINPCHTAEVYINIIKITKRRKKRKKGKISPTRPVTKCGTC